jgi:hypothetical protein
LHDTLGLGCEVRSSEQSIGIKQTRQGDAAKSTAELPEELPAIIRDCTGVSLRIVFHGIVLRINSRTHLSSGGALAQGSLLAQPDFPITLPVDSGIEKHDPCSRMKSLGRPTDRGVISPKEVLTSIFKLVAPLAGVSHAYAILLVLRGLVRFFSTLCVCTSR